MAAEAAEEMEAAEEVEEEEEVEEVHVHVLPGTKVFMFNEEDNKGRRRLVVHYYVDNMAEAAYTVSMANFHLSFARSYLRLGFVSIVFGVHYLMHVDDDKVLAFPKFEANKVLGSRFDRHLGDRTLGVTSLSRIDFFQQTEVDARPVRARALGTIVYNPMERGEAQVVHYKHELLYYLSEEPRPLTLQEWQCLGHLKRGHDSNFITFVFKVFPEGVQKQAQQLVRGFYENTFRRRIRSQGARRMAAAVGFQIREHMAFALGMTKTKVPYIWRMFRSLHNSDDIVTPPFRPNHCRGRHPDLRLEHHHVYHVYPLPPEVLGVPVPLHVLDFPETNPAFAPHLKVVLHLFYHYPPDLVNGFGRQDTETLRQFMFDAPPVDNINRKYHRVVIHPVMYSRPIRSFLQSPGVSLVNSRAYPVVQAVEMFETVPVITERITLYIYPGTRVFCLFREKPLRKSRERQLYLVYFVSDFKMAQIGLDSYQLQRQLEANIKRMYISMVGVSITYMYRPNPVEFLSFNLVHFEIDFPIMFDERSDITTPGMTHLSCTTFVEGISPDGKPSRRHAYATGKGFYDPLEGAPYSQDCLVYLSGLRSALTPREWEAQALLRDRLGGQRGSRVTFVFKLPFVPFDKIKGVIERVMGPDAQTLAQEHGFEIQPYVAYPFSDKMFQGENGCLFNSIQRSHNYGHPPSNRINPVYYKGRPPGEQVEFHYSYHLYPGVDGKKIVPLDASRLPYPFPDEHTLRILHLFFHYPQSVEMDGAFEQQTNNDVQMYVNANNPYAKYHEVQLHSLYIPPPSPPPSPPSSFSSSSSSSSSP